MEPASLSWSLQSWRWPSSCGVMELITSARMSMRCWTLHQASTSRWLHLFIPPPIPLLSFSGMLGFFLSSNPCHHFHRRCSQLAETQLWRSSISRCPAWSLTSQWPSTVNSFFSGWPPCPQIGCMGLGGLSPCSPWCRSQCGWWSPLWQRPYRATSWRPSGPVWCGWIH